MKLAQSHSNKNNLCRAEQSNKGGVSSIPNINYLFKVQYIFNDTSARY